MGKVFKAIGEAIIGLFVWIVLVVLLLALIGSFGVVVMVVLSVIATIVVVAAIVGMARKALGIKSPKVTTKKGVPNHYER